MMEKRTHSRGSTNMETFIGNDCQRDFDGFFFLLLLFFVCFQDLVSSLHTPPTSSPPNQFITYVLQKKGNST